jgi:predicted nucleotidyltransferase component of viral defense system
MILPNPREALHQSQLYKLLTEIADNAILSKGLIFKGGTCAAMQRYLDRFSVDLDFDLAPNTPLELIKKELERVFSDLNLEISSALRLDAIGLSLPENITQPVFLTDINRYLECQTVETMFANKLAAVWDRYDRHSKVAGRDIYDIYYFFLNGYRYSKEIVHKRTGVGVRQYLEKLVKFIEEKVTQTDINEDLNTLLPPEKFKTIRKTLKTEVIGMLKSEIERLREERHE